MTMDKFERDLIRAEASEKVLLAMNGVETHEELMKLLSDDDDESVAEWWKKRFEPRGGIEGINRKLEYWRITGRSRFRN